MGWVAQGLIAATDAGRGAQDPGTGTSFVLIAAVVVAVIVGAAVLFGVFHRLTRASRGGVQSKPGEFGPGGPPFESFGRRR